MTQPDAYACRKHCESREAPYFKYKIERGKCYCKKTRGRRKRQDGTISGVAKGCGGGMISTNTTTYSTTTDTTVATTAAATGESDKLIRSIAF